MKPDQPRILSASIHLFTIFGIFLLFAQPSRAQNSLDGIRRRHELVIGTDSTYPPFEFKAGKVVQGFDVEVGNAIGRQIGVPVRWLSIDWASIFGALDAGKCDIVMSGVTITDERKKKGFVFSRPYFLSGQAIARRKGDPRIKSFKDLKDKTVSVQMETTGQFALEKLGVPRSHINRFDELQDGLLDVRNGKSDAAVADLPALLYNLRRSYTELELVGGVFKEENIGVVIRRGAPDVLKAVNTALDKIMVDGTYARVYDTWIHEPVTTGMMARLDKVKQEGTAPASQFLDAAPSTDTTAVDASTQPEATLNIRWGLLREGFPKLLSGAELTLGLTALTLLLGVVSGLVVALCRISPIPPIRMAATAYIEVIRGTPLLMQIYVIYFVLPLFHISLDAFVSGVLAMTLNAAAYISEIFRAGIESIDSGQMEAARALGMDYGGAMRWVILPQTIRRVLPPLTNEAVALLKDSSLVSVVALSELMRNGKELATTSGSPTTIYLGVAVIYLVMTLPLTFAVRRLETAWQPISKPAGGAGPAAEKGTARA